MVYDEWEYIESHLRGDRTVVNIVVPGHGVASMPKESRDLTLAVVRQVLRLWSANRTNGEVPALHSPSRRAWLPSGTAWHRP